MAAGAGKKEEKQVEATDEAAEAKQKKKKLFMFIGLAVLLVLISVGATFFIVSKMLGKHGEDEDSGSSESSAASEKSLPAIYYALKPNFTVNYDVNGRQRFLQTELTLMYRDESVMKVLEEHMPEVRNGLVMLLSKQVFDDLQTVEGKEKLRSEALKTVQEVIEKETQAEEDRTKKDKDKSKDKEKEKDKKAPANVEQVLFTQFVMQ